MATASIMASFVSGSQVLLALFSGVEPLQPYINSVSLIVSVLLLGASVEFPLYIHRATNKLYRTMHLLNVWCNLAALYLVFQAADANATGAAAGDGGADGGGGSGSGLGAEVST